jgi:hypothetical protein
VEANISNTLTILTTSEINVLETNNKKKNIKNYSGTSDIKKVYQPRNNTIKG